MTALQLVLALGLLTVSGAATIAQTKPAGPAGNTDEAGMPAPAKQTAPLDAKREKQAFRIFFKSVGGEIVPAAEGKPATKYEFIPTERELRGVRTFALEVRHLSATNHGLAAAALGEILGRHRRAGS